MAEAGSQVPGPGVGVLAVSSPSHHTRFARKLVNDAGHGPIVSDGDSVTDLGRAEGPQQRHALGGGEGEVVAGAAGGPAHDPKVGPVGGATVEKVPQGCRIHFAGESHTGRGGADPLAGGLAVAQVVVVHRVGHTLEVVVGARSDPEASYREHGRATHGVTTDGEPGMERDHPGGCHLGRHLPSSWVGFIETALDVTLVGNRLRRSRGPTRALRVGTARRAAAFTQCRRVSLTRVGRSNGVKVALARPDFLPASDWSKPTFRRPGRGLSDFLCKSVTVIGD